MHWEDQRSSQSSLFGNQDRHGERIRRMLENRVYSKSSLVKESKQMMDEKKKINVILQENMQFI